MAPNTFEQQTFEIISCLFQDPDVDVSRRSNGGSFETDGLDDDDDFDPVIIADKLKEVADHLDKEFLKPHIEILQKAAAEKAVEEFARSVYSLCISPIAQKAEVAHEFQLLKASMALGLYGWKSYPELKGTIQNAMTTFINNRLAGWIGQQGGWEKVSNL